MPRNKLIFGAAVLLIANLLNRTLGFIYQYLIMHYIGSETFGLYQMVFPLYMTALVFTTAGIPLAVSKLVSEKQSIGRHADAQKIFQVALLTLSIFGLLITILLFQNSAFIVDRFIADKRVLTVFQICIPSIFVVSIASAFRGYFQGQQNMIPSALSQVCEQIFRVAVGFTLSFKLLSRGIEWAAAGLAAGMLGGEILGLTVIALQYLLRSRRKVIRETRSSESAVSILGSLLTLSLPVTGGRLVSTGLSSLDSILIPRQLQISGYDPRLATSLFGQLGGTAMTLLNFPSVFSFAMATSLVPAISEAMVRKDYKLAQSRCSDAIRFTIILGLPCVIILFFYAEPLTNIFNSRQIAGVLQILAVGGLFAYLQQTTTGILQGLGKTYLPLIHSAIGGAVRIPLLFYLTGLPRWGLLGTACSYTVAFCTLAFLNFKAIERHIGLHLDVQAFLIQPFSAGIGMIAVIWMFNHLTSDFASKSLLSAVLSFLAYILILMLNGGLRSQELKKIPILHKFIR